MDSENQQGKKEPQGELPTRRRKFVVEALGISDGLKPITPDDLPHMKYPCVSGVVYRLLDAPIRKGKVGAEGNKKA